VPGRAGLHFPQCLLRRQLGEVTGAERDAHQHVPEALGSPQRVTASRPLPVELQFAEDFAGRLLAQQLEKYAVPKLMQPRMYQKLSAPRSA
jgi:hypothetical protein